MADLAFIWDGDLSIYSESMILVTHGLLSLIGIMMYILAEFLPELADLKAFSFSVLGHQGAF